MGTCCCHCEHTIRTEYVRIGTTVVCPNCLILTLPQVPEGGRIVRGGGYQVSYENFRRLIDYPPYREVVAPLLMDWFGYSIVEEGPDVWVKNIAGVSIDPLWLHLLIQGDPKQQDQLYNTAMSLWHNG
jgi:hypothetical protein